MDRRRLPRPLIAAELTAALTGDFDEARFRSHLIAAKADGHGLTHCLPRGPRGHPHWFSDSEPMDGLSHAILDLADALCRVNRIVA